jgi:hypothetical protein
VRLEPNVRCGLTARGSDAVAMCRTMRVVLLLGVISACSGTDLATVPTEPSTISPSTISPSTISPSTMETTTTVAPTTTEVAIDYAMAYRRAIAPGNCARSVALALEDEIFGTTGTLTLEDATERWEVNREALRDAFTAFAAGMREIQANLLAIDWPAEIQSDIEQLAAESGAEAAGYDEIAAAEDYLTYYNFEFSFEFGDWPSRIRSALGLPPFSRDLTDWCALMAS